MLLTLLAFWHQTSTYLTFVWNVAKSQLRLALGPAPQNYYLLQDGRVLPTTIRLPDSELNNAFIYDPNTLRLYQNNTPQDVRFRRLPYLAASFDHVNTGLIDISDWLGEIRANPVPELPLKQLLTLWSLVHNQYVPLSNGVQINVTKNDGETDLIIFD
jgi:hypothetical protein